MYPTEETSLLHGQRVIPCYMKVSVTYVVPRYESVLLPIPDKDFDFNTLKEAVGSFIQWPLLKMRPLNKKKVPTNCLLY